MAMYEVTGPAEEVMILKFAKILKDDELGFGGTFVSTEQIAAIAKDLLARARLEGYFVCVNR